MVKRLLDFLNASPVNFLAAKNIANELEQAGYRRLDPQMPIGEVNAILAMHSCMETGSTADHIYCVKAFTKFFS
jgi:aspartyl aminopeptidase